MDLPIENKILMAIGGLIVLRGLCWFIVGLRMLYFERKAEKREYLKNRVRELRCHLVNVWNEYPMFSPEELLNLSKKEFILFQIEYGFTFGGVDALGHDLYIHGTFDIYEKIKNKFPLETPF